jgi:hypothetical protein
LVADVPRARSLLFPVACRVLLLDVCLIIGCGCGCGSGSGSGSGSDAGTDFFIGGSSFGVLAAASVVFSVTLERVLLPSLLSPTCSSTFFFLLVVVAAVGVAVALSLHSS